MGEATSPSDTSSSAPDSNSGPEPIAVVGFSCRLPGRNHSPTALWDFLKRGGCATLETPESRFNFRGHNDTSLKPGTMRAPGGMFLEDLDPRDIDAQFFGLSRVEAISMNPQQRQILEVVYEGLENAGISLEMLRGKSIGCFVSSYASDYEVLQSRDPEDKTPASTIGTGRAMLSNRVSHFLNVHGPSMTIDTACSGGLVAVDVASHYLKTKEIECAIVAGCNLYLNPDHTMDTSMNGAISVSGRCHTFDEKADGYVKAEGVNAVILKHLDDAIEHSDPIRAVLRGSATNSDGWTAGIASPNSSAQALAIRQAYRNARIDDLSSTSYIECHGTGTPAGDPIEVAGVLSAFRETCSSVQPLMIGSIKSNIGHLEPAAGISGMLKTVLALENGVIPGNPTFEKPNPKIDFGPSGVRVATAAFRWPNVTFRRACVNSFGYGGSNATVVLDEAKAYLKGAIPNHVSSFILEGDDVFSDDAPSLPSILVFSANDEASLKSYCQTISRHLIDPRVNIKLSDLSYTLSERRTRHFHRAYVIARATRFDLSSVVYGKIRSKPPGVSFIFTGQGAQWPQMGKDIVDTFPSMESYLRNLDSELQSLPHPPNWSLLAELTQPRRPEQLREPELSQSLATAIQLLVLEIFGKWNIRPRSVVGHSSGEIAAAVSAGLLTPKQAIKIAYYRGKAASIAGDEFTTGTGMLALGISTEKFEEYGFGSHVHLACINSSSSITLSGLSSDLEEIKARVQADGHFARLLQVNLPYHSKLIVGIAAHYKELLDQGYELPILGKEDIAMFSTVTGSRITGEILDTSYWERNMVSPVLFKQAVNAMVCDQEGSDILIEIGPSGALAGPLAQILKENPKEGSSFEYLPALERAVHATNAMFHIAGRIFIAGGAVKLSSVIRDETSSGHGSVVVDLPNYTWNHSVKYWHESDSSKNWRFREFVRHDLLGSKILGTSWHAPSWRAKIRVWDIPWLEDHKLSGQTVFPAAGYIAMAIEAAYQTQVSTGEAEAHISIYNMCYRLRNVVFMKAMIFDERQDGQKVMFTLTRQQDNWHEFTVSTLTDDVWTVHCKGLICVMRIYEGERKAALEPPEHITPAHLWYKAMHTVGYSFGPHFRKQLGVEATVGCRSNKTMLSLTEPASRFIQSSYPMHPACIDGCLQAGGPSLWQGQPNFINALLIPASIDELVINCRTEPLQTGIAIASAEYSGVGPIDLAKNYKSHVSVYDSKTKSLLLKMSGLAYHELEILGLSEAVHKYTYVSWKPDMTFATQAQLRTLIAGERDVKSPRSEQHKWAEARNILDLIAHKKQGLKVMEVNMLDLVESIWLGKGGARLNRRAASRQFHLCALSTGNLLSLQEKYEGIENVEFGIIDLMRPSAEHVDFDLLIITSPSISSSDCENLIRNSRRLLCSSGEVLFLVDLSCSSKPGSGTSVATVEANENPTNPIDILQANGFSHALGFPGDYEAGTPTSQLYHAITSRGGPDVPSSVLNCVNLVRFSSGSESRDEIRAALMKHGWQVTNHHLKSNSIQLKEEGICLVLDELCSAMLTSIDAYQWQALQHLIHLGRKVLWVTTGAHFKVTQPDKALASGLFRTLRAENPGLVLANLDVESASGTRATAAITAILSYLDCCPQEPPMESEFVERGGIIYISRIVPDHPMNEAERVVTHGSGNPLVMPFFDHKSCIRLICPRLGNFDSLCFQETSMTELPLEDGFVEVDIHAAGLNFKDVATVLGIVPDDVHRLGLEGAGIIRRIGAHAGSFTVGQRVLVHGRGCFANRVQCPVQGTHLLPDYISFEKAATLPCVWLVVLYALRDICTVKAGESVLIHSAAGGVGIAAIQLCRYIGVKIFVTVEHIFDSRSSGFATKLKAATGGQGVNVILSSLTGDLLDESWRCIADGGTMVEIGKADIVGRKSLSMEPFSRNASYRAVDMSHRSISRETTARLLSELFGLLAENRIDHACPVKTFGFDEFGAAYRYMRQGNHIGKIVFSKRNQESLKVPIRPAMPILRFRDDVAYLLVGGLKGLCGSLAIYMAYLGARHLIVVSRSGISPADVKPKDVLRNLEALNVEVDIVEGDVSVVGDVQNVFRNSTKPIAGIIQGAMVLKDKTFDSMTVEDFHAAIRAKVAGTWNLHNAALEHHAPLDFFTLLSSISGVIGQTGQANYAAANTFLDSFAAYRHGQGLPASSIDLGVIEDVGYISEREELAQRLDKAAWTPISERLLHKILRVSILQQTSPINPASASQTITGIPVPQKKDSLLLRDARFGGLDFGDSETHSTGVRDSSGDINAFRKMLKAKVNRSTLLAGTIDIVNRQFMRTLNLSEPIEPGRPLSSYGLDSLAAIEIRNWVRMDLDIEISTLDINNAISLSSLCEKMVAKLFPAQGSSGLQAVHKQTPS